VRQIARVTPQPGILCKHLPEDGDPLGRALRVINPGLTQAATLGDSSPGVKEPEGFVITM